MEEPRTVSRINAIMNLHITPKQAEELDKLDCNDKDGIAIDIYTMAKMALAKNDKKTQDFYREELSKNKADMSIFPLVDEIINGKEQPKVDYFSSSGRNGKTHYTKQ